MTEAEAESNRSLLACPACSRVVGIPAVARGMPVVCPHCKASFRVVVESEQMTAFLLPTAPAVPRSLLVPIYGLLLLGMVGCFVSGFLVLRFLRVPGGDYDYAYARAIEYRSTLAAGSEGRPTDDEWEQLPSAAIGGAAGAVAAAPILEDSRNKDLATAWRPAMMPTTLVSLGLSIVTLLGGAAMVSGRLYPLAFVGCLAAIVNVNYLCCLPGGVVGIWGILMLVRDEVRPHFGRTAQRR